MSEGEPFVDESPRRQRRHVQLARGKVNLTVPSVDRVPVVIDGHEVVVGADFLELLEGLHQEITLPQADVVDGGAIRFDVRDRQLDFPRRVASDDLVESPRPASGIDVVAQVRGLARQLVWRDDEALKCCRDKSACNHTHYDVKDGCGDG